MKVYADHAATTPMRPEAKKAMIEALEDFGNPSSIHALGRLASAKMESARKEIAELLNCRPAEVYFTSGGSEADNWAIRAARYGAGDVVASAFEHHAVLHTLEAMERSGTRRAVLVAPGTNGIIDPAEIGRRVSSTTNMVTVMAANNEVGTLQPIQEISKEIRKSGSKLTVFHTDAVQAIGHIPVDVQKMGVDMLVMDDGWFGDKYPRKNDSYALGDWTVDKTKLPGGLQSLLDNARKHGIRFGIWLEPEMANTKSELYEKHPEWIIKAPEREVVCARGGTQVVLDLSNPQVQDFIVQTVDELMNSYPDIDYIKWDANMSIITQGSQYLTKDNQSHLNIEYHRGFENVCRRIRASYPQLTIQACASGGGRVNYGVLPYFDEFWTSDNTDALQRIYIQWGTSYFFPAIGMGAHISASPNHQTSRSVPLKFRIDVAMSGRLGMEIQPKNMTEEEKALCRNAIAEYKTIRPVVQFGDIYRLLSPYDKQGAASLMYVSPEKDKAVFYWWKTEHFCNRHLPRVKMAGLAPDKYYKVHELNRIDTEPLKFEGKSFSGAYLNDNGLEIPSTHRVEPSKQNEYASRVLYLEKVTPSFSDNRIEQRPPLRVLCLGNSITRHEYKADIEWFSEWGMAASKEENDYCHQLEKMLSQNRPGTVVTPLNIAYWERNLNCNIDSLIGTHVTDKDVIVIRLGENVQDKEAFKSGILRLVEYCKRKADKVVITGCFWKDEEKERAIINAAHMHGLTFIPIDWIDRLYNSRPKVGDTLYDIHGKPYTVTKDFIIAHPDDEGMKKIAEAIYRVL